MVAIYLAAGEESMAADVVHNNPGGLLPTTTNNKNDFIF